MLQSRHRLGGACTQGTAIIRVLKTMEVHCHREKQKEKREIADSRDFSGRIGAPDESGLIRESYIYSVG